MPVLFGIPSLFLVDVMMSTTRYYPAHSDAFLAVAENTLNYLLLNPLSPSPSFSKHNPSPSCLNQAC